MDSIRRTSMALLVSALAAVAAVPAQAVETKDDQVGLKPADPERFSGGLTRDEQCRPGALRGEAAGPRLWRVPARPLHHRL